MQPPKKSGDIAFQSQKEAEIAWLKETQPPDVLKELNFNLL